MSLLRMRKHLGFLFLFLSTTVVATESPVITRARNQDNILPNYSSVALYKPTYLLPYYYTGSPDNNAYEGTTPNNETLKHNEFKFQFSAKVPIWKNILGHRSTLWGGYTQLSYWQVYSHHAFMRENDYEPELFVANEVNWHLFKHWNLNFLNVGVTHESNGFGNSLQRGWDKIYLDLIASSTHWMVSLKPWLVMDTNSHNNNITNYLGYGRILVAFKCHDHVVALTAHNLIEGGARHATAQLTWSFPLIPYLKGYVQVFSGYGQSLIEYNHRTNSAGIGLALSDWV